MNGLQGVAGSALTNSLGPVKNRQLTIQEVENGFAVTENYNTIRVYLTFESMAADIKTYFGCDVPVK